MLTIPQFLEFPSEGNIKELCVFFLSILEHKNKALYLHSQQVSNYSVSISAQMGLPCEEVTAIKTAALLHDLGHLAVPNTILNKYPYLSTRELSTYKNHCLAGASMLENIPEFMHIVKIIMCHHENWNGTGYPKRLKGVNIPLGARIIAVANYYDRFINPCTQHWQKSHNDAVKELQNQAGLMFDPDIVQAFLKSLIIAKKNK
ncbi:MAG TPA: HD domain-containing protein [Candidatus Avacidaminococcus intestinavium]|uniref:HD domain-containing protein n=1 Tax=Candidatus Avacidaminococcus intestinavium TaxID=2840684 RepID=A0A9D1MNB3_9FIRM|nr:HD domain-containing protein [Candidatus Avacidaminococcus intestinavium]